jgi:hypothetical protein
MIEQRVSCEHMGIGLAIAIGVAAIFASAVEAEAQVDPNLQATVNIYSPAVTVVQPSAPAVNPGGLFARSGTKLIPIDSDEFEQLVADKAVAVQRQLAKTLELQSRSEAVKSPSFQRNLQILQGANIDIASEKATRESVHALRLNDLNMLKQLAASLQIPVLPVAPSTTPQPTTLKVSFPLNPTYETDVLKSGNNSSPGASIGFGGSAQVTAAGFRQNDLMAVLVGSGSGRYPAFPTKSLDTFVAQGLYQFYLDAYQGDGSLIDPKNPPKALNPNNVTVDTLGIGVLDQDAYTAGYHNQIANLLTPQITLSRQNINLSGNSAPCTTIYNPLPGFCNFANLTLIVGQTASDVLSQQNANITASGTLGWRINKTDLTVAVQAAALGRYYENFAGGRQDLQLQAGTLLTYVPSGNISFSLPVTYYKNYSSFAPAAWSGFVIQPTLTIAFTYPAPPAMPPN